ncbi:25S rRNA (uridine(2843)-N(3))-methyltransferase [Cytospora mali]|uniref:25S rRNA (Uridine(2843)-N(3))-methyltransferase n=1 Tax=Cytospora mali TaxID=578113 RepID=A0A194WD46_CYTMA|nr:25S rRNA (uridine(2843)-N(3))-methyltransferase [Valsa mali]
MVKKPAPKSSSKPKPSSKPSSKQPNTGKLREGNETTHPGGNRIRQSKPYQQKVLNVFQDAFNSVLSSGNFTAILQEVKTALFNRDFDKAFGNEEYLEAYAARWSPTRALCYASVLDGIGPHLDELSRTKKTDGSVKAEDETEASLKVVAIGGGAAEVVAVGSFLGQQPSALPCSTILLDVGPWANVVEKLRVGVTTPPTLSRYASAAVQAANSAIVSPERLADVTFKQNDILSLTKEEVSSLVGTSQPVLVTLLFTLNELFTISGIGKTTSFLLSLTVSVPAGSLLLVIDSPGSYSEATVGKESKRYPMQWLLNKILLETTEGAWEMVESQDSVWFRLSQGLEYPIPLEDMRYQMHLYRASGKDNAG